MSIQFLGVSKRFGDHILFENLNLTLLQGQRYCLMGASGSGKTTLVQMLMGFMKPDIGEIKGTSVVKMAVVFQEDRLIEHWDAVKNIRLVCDRSISLKAIQEDLKLVGLEEELGKPVRHYSGGMRRRVAIVRALIVKSDLLILDEPFKGLDEALKLQVMDYIIQKSKGKTVLLVTHDKDEAVRLGAELITL